MSEFNAAHVVNQVKERSEQLAEGDKLIPIGAAVVAVFAALATLFANHSSVTALATKNQAILEMNKATDTWNYYQAKRIKLEVNRALITAGAVRNADGLKTMQATVAKQDRESRKVLVDAQTLQRASDDDYERAERFMRSYERYEVSATLFEVCVVLISITALTRTRALLWASSGATVIGIIFFIQGWLLH